MVKSSPRLFKHGFTLIELLIVMALIAILAALATRVFKSVLDRAKATKDMSNLRQMGIAMQTYLNDSDQILPVSTTWPGTTAGPTPNPGLYPKYVATRKVFQSPFDKRTPSEANDGTPPISYSINTNMYAKLGTNPSMLKVVSPASTFLMAPNYAHAPGDPGNSGSWPGIAGNAPDLLVGGTGETTGTHNNGRQINVLFCDWHTESVSFGPGTGTFQDSTSNPLGLKHWDPTQ
jgi:prepilin-type N-terminal cleavage/methylation domain-containing protein/prepilin-type processing-associated H-X9-DG protein